jgi:hypothetical protein
MAAPAPAPKLKLEQCVVTEVSALNAHLQSFLTLSDARVLLDLWLTNVTLLVSMKYFVLEERIVRIMLKSLQDWDWYEQRAVIPFINAIQRDGQPLLCDMLQRCDSSLGFDLCRALFASAANGCYATRDFVSVVYLKPYANCLCYGIVFESVFGKDEKIRIRWLLSRVGKLFEYFSEAEQSKFLDCLRKADLRKDELDKKFFHLGRNRSRHGCVTKPVCSKSF